MRPIDKAQCENRGRKASVAAPAQKYWQQICGERQKFHLSTSGKSPCNPSSYKYVDKITLKADTSSSLPLPPLHRLFHFLPKLSSRLEPQRFLRQARVRQGPAQVIFPFLDEFLLRADQIRDGLY